MVVPGRVDKRKPLAWIIKLFLKGQQSLIKGKASQRAVFPIARKGC